MEETVGSNVEKAEGRVFNWPVYIYIIIFIIFIGFELKDIYF
jgi:hypothetical protein